MDHSFLVHLVISSALVFTGCVNANDAKFGRIITFDSFDHFQMSMNKTYHHDHQEKRARLAYEKNIELIKKHNEEARMGKHKYELRANDLADFTQDAYMKRFIRLTDNIHPEVEENPSVEDKEALLGSVRNDPGDQAYIPDALDWRELGFEMKPLNQLSCGSCYAFSVALSITAQVFRRTGKVVELSPQQIVDCSKENSGCHGGSLRTTLRYLQTTRGLMRDIDYPYASEQQKCQYKPSLAVVNVTKWAILRQKDEESLKKAIAVVGPVPISINARPTSFQLYSHGIYSDPSCTDETVNHAMLAIGYTPEYFILQNWWGDKWGESGIMKIERHHNRCGLANYAAYALV